jgi:fatty acid-binding protein DegV
MIRYAIITDDAAQGVITNPGGNVFMYTLEHHYLNGATPEQRVLPLSGGAPIAPPDNKELSSFLAEAIATFDEIFCITCASAISPLHLEIDAFVEKQKGRAHFHLIDSQSFGSGQGALVNLAVNLIQRQKSPQEIEETIRQAIPHTYSLFCSPNLSYLYTQGFLDAGQLIVGEQHDLLPVYSLENGTLNSLDKFKNVRGVSEYFLEFLQEYEDISNLQFIHPRQQALPFLQDFREYLSETPYANVQCLESEANPFLENLIGPHGFAMILTE